MKQETLYKTGFLNMPAIKRTLLLWCCLIGVFLSGTSQSLAQITGPSTVCSGVATTFNLSGTPNPSYTYNWSVIPAANSTILSSSPSSATIQWFNITPAAEIVQVIIVRPSLPNITWQKAVNVVPEPDPQISSNSQVGCQGTEVKGEKERKDENGVIINDGPCVKVCANATIQYDVTNGQSGSTFQWTVDPSKASFSGPSTGTTVYVNWSNNLGFTFIKVKETTAAGCVKEKTICIEIIESPQTLFSVNGDVYPVNPPCFEACVQAQIQFADLTPNPVSSPIVSWQWDFGDGTFSSLQNPTHVYTSPGSYSVLLTATNQCGCKGVYKVCIKVDYPNNPPLEISCPSIVCENAIGHYTINNTCGSMFWVVNGGTIISSTMTSIDIMWDNVGPSGFGEIIADFSSCGGNCGPKVTAQVPVILANGTIDGKTVICYGKQYKYQLPKWPATNFKWTIIPSSAATFVSFDQNSHEVNLVGYAPFTLHCEYQNTMELCAGKADLNINVVLPIVLTAPSKICLNDPFSVVSTTPASVGTTYTFIDPNGNTSFAGTFNMTGTWTVQASNPAYCDIEPISVQVVNPPAAVTSITGQLKVCLNTPYVYEAVTPVPNTLCNWTITGGTIITNSGNAVTVQWTTTGTKTLSVSRVWADVPGCSSAATSITVTVATPLASLSGNLNPCANTNEVYTATLLPLSSPIDNINWTLSPTSAGSVSAGQGSMAPTFTWNNTTTSVAVTITATLTKCGTTTIVNLPVTVIAMPTISIVPSSTAPCSGTPVTFTATTTPSGATINWTLPSGSTPPSVPTGTNPAVVTFTNVGLASQNFTVQASASIAGCPLVGTASTTIAVKPQPNINVSPGSGSTSTIVICPPTSVNLLLSTNATTSINWYYNGAGSPYATGVTSTTVSAAGNYRVDVTNSFGCLSSATRTIVHNCTPACTLPAGAGITSKSHIITACTNTAGQALINVFFNGILGSYPSGPSPVVTSMSVSGSVPFFNLPTPVYAFPNVSLTGITAEKPGVYPVTLQICYQTTTTPCCTLVTENVIVPVIADFDYTTNCVPGGYTLTLNDQSPVLSGYSKTNTWSTTGSGPSTPASTINLSLYTPGSTLTITNTVTVTGPAYPGGYVCTRTRTYTVPAVPSPAFSITTTDPLGPGYSSCAGREVVFTSLNNAGITKWTWAFGDGTGFIGTTSTATRTYANAALTTTAVLTLQDAFGCTFSTSKPIRIYPNTFSLNTVNTYTAQQDIKCKGTASPVTLIGVTGGYGSNAYAWFNEEVPTGFVGNPINVTQDGLYWAMVTDARGCMQPGNPTPAKRAFQPLPDVAITGEHDFCPNEAITLSAANGTTTGVTFQWEQLIGMTWVPISSSAVLSIPSGLSAGVYQYRVSATQNLPSPYSGACTAVSPVYTVTVHGIPAVPTISGPFAVNCANYSIQLNVASPAAGEIYNWSNGTAGTSTIVNHGGAYRVWAKNTWGCTNHADIDVPMEPSSYFWRFPHGCYDYCRLQLPRRVDGPTYQTFTTWKWFIGGGGLPFPNGPWASSGGFSPVDPLNINLIPGAGDGNGSGMYSWYLDNGLCAETSHSMTVNLTEDCCEMDARLAYLRCEILPGSKTPTYYGAFDISGIGCSNAIYTIYAVDPVTGLANGTVLPASGVYTGGSINFSYNPFPGVTDVRFKVVISCDGKDCISRDIDAHLRDYPCRDTRPCDMDRAWKDFYCVGGSTPHFAGVLSVNYTMGCAPATYTIIAVDPVTGMPNGTVSPATGSLSSGWTGISFNYYPNAGVTSVRFLLVVSCKDMVCYTDLGQFDGLNDRKHYPCKDGTAKTTPESEKTGASDMLAAKMLIAPNPANSNVKISFEIPEWKQGDVYKIHILNLLGQSVGEYTVNAAQGNWQYTTVQLSSGTYLVRLVKDGGNVDVQRMIIAH